MELHKADIIELVELVAKERIGALRVVVGDVELVLGMDSATVAALSASAGSDPVGPPRREPLVAIGDLAGTADTAARSGGAPEIDQHSAEHESHAGVAVEDEDAVSSGRAVTAPLLGIFYSAAEPGAPPYVEVGDHVGPDTTVGLIEAMKVFTAVQAGSSGLVRRILVGNEDFVEFGQALMELEER